MTAILVPSQESGVALSEGMFPGDPGLHIVFGKNNSGKSRTLKALIGARVHTEGICPPKHRGSLWNFFEGQLRYRGIELMVASNRDRSSITIGVESLNQHGNHQIDQRLVDVANQAVAQWGTPGLSGKTFLTAIAEAAPKPRPAHLVPSNRYMAPSAPLGDEPTLPFDPQSWPPDLWPAFLEMLRNSPEGEPRDAFAKIAESFSYVTEGLKLEFRGGRTRTVYIVDGDTEQPLDKCGDGLRDLLGIMIYCHCAPDHDLFIEEPGTRLHPGAQKRLLSLLEQESTQRAIWLTSHDNPYLFARSAKARYVTRKVGASISVTPTGTDADHQESMRLLGWEPAMAALADIIIYCEGPSDSTAFERALAGYPKRVKAFDVGGSGEIESDKRWGSLMRNISFTSQLLPHIRQIVIIDLDNKEERRQKLIQQLSARGIAAATLPCQMLESYWIRDDSIRAIATELASSAARMAGLQLHDSKVDEAIASTSGETHAKKRLAAVCDLLCPGSFHEVRAVEAAFAINSPATEALRRDLEKLLEPAS